MRVVIVSGPEKGLNFSIQTFPVTIGRYRDADVVIGSDGRLSRLHCRLTHEKGAYFLEDLNSRHGTWAFGRRISVPVKVVNGALFRVGDSELVFADNDLVVNPELIRLAPLTLEMVSGSADSETLVATATAEDMLRNGNALATIVEAIGQPATFGEQLQRSCKVLLNALAADLVAVLVVDETEIHPIAAVRSDGRSGGSLVISRGLLERAKDARRPVLLPDVNSDSVLKVHQSIVSTGLRSLFCAPVQNFEGLDVVLYGGVSGARLSAAELPIINQVATILAERTAQYSAKDELQKARAEASNYRRRYEAVRQVLADFLR